MALGVLVGGSRFSFGHEPKTVLKWVSQPQHFPEWPGTVSLARRPGASRTPHPHPTPAPHARTPRPHPAPTPHTRTPTRRREVELSTLSCRRPPGSAVCSRVPGGLRPARPRGRVTWAPRHLDTFPGCVNIFSLDEVELNYFTFCFSCF